MLAQLLERNDYELSFNILAAGALPVAGTDDRFHGLLELFPSSRISAFELDAELCERLNREARPGLRYYARALGRTEERRELFETVDGVCTSLYEPDERFSDRFNKLEAMRLKQRSIVDTVSLDRFAEEQGIGAVDFIKMDIQGAELDVLRGGEETLNSVLALVCEVEFVPLYKGQPLYGDVDAHLRARGFMLHTFLGFGGRVVKPLAKRGMSYYPIQMLWSDALFSRDLLSPPALTQEQLLKLAVLFDLYDSCDVALDLIRLHDSRHGSALGDAYLEMLLGTQVWSKLGP